ncbi:uncharacterized protein LMH87_007579 [Akanthomyces muscarius]|uniref:Uncharacterized protein n=1 Tax=Akanthomyces muscarius TaxID=2231603 RepID=A0A9W8URF1_AKAMU|nr:uncharacterized protein LMH87_007579 [Akanthomyces muscarius]KAJ4161545.1 hypothetical protein LMH87_007579 [Akanthomyces muscarius]
MECVAASQFALPKRRDIIESHCEIIHLAAGTGPIGRAYVPRRSGSRSCATDGLGEARHDESFQVGRYYCASGGSAECAFSLNTTAQIPKVSPGDHVAPPPIMSQSDGHCGKTTVSRAIQRKPIDNSYNPTLFFGACYYPSPNHFKITTW